MFTTLTFSAEELFDTPGRLGLITLVNNGLAGVLDHTITGFSLIARDTQARNGLYLDAVINYSNDPVAPIAAPFTLHVFPARGTAQGLVKAQEFQADNPGWFYSPIFAVFSDSVEGANGLPYLVWMVSSTDPNAGDNWSVASAAVPVPDLAGDVTGPIDANTVVAIQNKAVPAPAVGGTRLVYDIDSDALVWYSTPVYASLANAVAGQANQIIGERIVIYSEPATSETGTYVINDLTGDESDYTKKSDATDTAAEVGIVDAGGYYPGITEVESALQYIGPRLLDAPVSTLNLTDAVANTINTVDTADTFTAVEWSVTMFNTSSNDMLHYTIQASYVNGETPQFTVSGLGPSLGEVFDIDVVAGPPEQLLLQVIPDGADWNAIVTRTVLHGA